MNRRHFIQQGLLLAAGSLSACVINKPLSQSKQRVVVVGGGYAGASVAKYIRLWSQHHIEVVVVEPNPYFISCPLSNLVLGGSKTIDDLSFTYDSLIANHGIQWVKDHVMSIQTEKKTIHMARGSLRYDRLVIAPGIDFNYDAMPALQDSSMQLQIPHAWKAGKQTVALRRQLEGMADGGVFVMTIPLAPYRCPPGPYERVCQVASYFKQHKPKSKIIVLDANPEIVSKKGLFNKVFIEMYAGMIDYRPNSAIQQLDATTKTIKTEFETERADVLNVIPAQLAGKVAQLAQLTNIDKRWCEVDFLSYESKVSPNVHVIGDAVFSALPKSAHMATSQARVCAAAIVSLMHEQQPDPTPVFANTCYSFVNDHMAMHVANVYRYHPEKQVMLPAEGGGVSAAPSSEEGKFGMAWAQNIWSDTLT